MRRRVCERFLQPIRELERFDKRESSPFRQGFAIAALDCLLIDTIQSFREGLARLAQHTALKASSPHQASQTLRSKNVASFSIMCVMRFSTMVRRGRTGKSVLMCPACSIETRTPGSERLIVDC